MDKIMNEEQNSNVRRSFTYDDLIAAYFQGFDNCNEMWAEGINTLDFDEWFNKNYA